MIVYVVQRSGAGTAAYKVKLDGVSSWAALEHDASSGGFLGGVLVHGDGSTGSRVLINPVQVIQFEEVTV